MRDEMKRPGVFVVLALMLIALVVGVVLLIVNLRSGQYGSAISGAFLTIAGVVFFVAVHRKQSSPR